MLELRSWTHSALTLLVGATLLAVTSHNLKAQDGSMRGFADIHNHQFANLAFGGKLVTGSPYGALSDLSAAADLKNHSSGHLSDVMGGYLAGYPGPITYGNDGFPNFGGWPAFFEVSHQKVYQDWLFWAVQGGMRLMVMMAVESPPLCPLIGNNGCPDEMTSINWQIDGAYAMQQHIDQQFGGDGRGWYRIVTTPAQARQVIQQGKLAVVLGVETAHLFNCQSEPCSWEGPLQSLWARGVRHFFPIHHADNAFGGPSYFKTQIQAQNNWVGDVFNPLHWFTPYKLFTHPCSYDFGRCDDHGLTATGKAFVQGLMQLGAIIDVDHMSDRSFSDTLDIAEANGYPVVASHAGFNEINKLEQDHEGQLTNAELQRISGVGGMLGLISQQGDIHTVATYQRPGKHTVPYICGNSSETFAQAFYYAIDHAPGMSLAIGTDFNGSLRQVGPRFGGHQCDGGQGKSPKWNVELKYPFFARGANLPVPQFKTGNRLFNYNEDGLAHVGLLPDMFADLEALQMSPSDLEPLFNSAEGYVKMWEKAQPFRDGQWADVDGDGQKDYCRLIGSANLIDSQVECTLSKVGNGAKSTSAILDWGYEAGRAWVDVNGDGKADYCRVSGNSTNGYVICTLSTGTGFGATISSGSLDWGYEAGREWVDVNGDGKADYCRVGGNSTNGYVICTLSTGTGFGATISSGSLDWGYEAGREWVDVNGDGKADYCRVGGGPGNYYLLCTLSTGSGFGATISSGNLDLGYEAGRAWVDVNGDGKADYCRVAGDLSNKYVLCTLSTGTGFGTTIASGSLDWGYDYGRAWVDVNGDHKGDYCRVGGITGNKYVMCTPSVGSGFGATFTVLTLN
jgi:microsomal dipeptidase-like Zn-dependent dipeptidase